MLEVYGTKLVLYFFKFFLIKSHPHINDSLFTIAIFFENFESNIVGLNHLIL